MESWEKIYQDGIGWKGYIMSILQGKVAIVTGAGRGMGRAIAEAYLQQGAQVTVTAAREQSELQDLEQRWSSAQLLTLLADVTDADACEHVVVETLRRFGQIDVLVNNAGRGMKYVSTTFMAEPTRFWEVSPETWQMIIDTNVNGPFYMTRAVVPHMLQRGGGSIINISMNYETMKRRGFSPYGPSKAAIESASAIWAQDLAQTGIRVTILLPGGATNTGMIPPGVSEEARTRLLQPSMMAAPAVFLAADASRSVTGRRLIATEWSPEHSEGHPITDGIGR
jgi:NAD(P)-dependent dehydrogenase (short-subunit alcohol dehydrogenase family)